MSRFAPGRSPVRSGLARWGLGGLLFFAAAAAGGARAQGIDMTKGGAIDVTSDNGMEWLQQQQEIIANGNAKAVRGDVTVTADRLIAFYRKKAGAQTAADAHGAAKPVSATGAAVAGSPTDTGDNEIYRLEAEGNVHIFTPTDQAFADRAVYDIDQAVLVMTGHNLHIITPSQTMSARDTMEYWSQKHMSVGRGDAVVTTSDGRQVRADILVGYTADPHAPGGAGQASPPKAAAPAPGKAGTNPVADAGGKLERVDAFGHVEVRTATEIAHADKGVYIPGTEIARLEGNVHITRGENQLNGDDAVVDLRTGVSTISRTPGSRVEGLVVPNDARAEPDGKAAAPAKAKRNAS